MALLPLPSDHVPKLTTLNFLLQGRGDFTQIVAFEGLVLAVVLQSKDIKMETCRDPVVKELLLQFPNISNESLPMTLPPERVSDHPIDLISGASLPNLPHYHMSPRKIPFSKNRLIILQKGLICPSRSPCAVTASTQERQRIHDVHRQPDNQPNHGKIQVFDSLH